MAIKHNQTLVKHHFHKDWDRRVQVHFEQPGRKHRRREARAAKAAALAPRPIDKLRPIVRCPTVKYNRRVRAGRGFSLEELKAVNLNRKYAATIGIAVDHRRVNRSEEAFAANVARLQEYKKRLIVLPTRGSKVSDEELKKGLKSLGSTFPVTNPKPADAVAEINKSDIPTAEKSAYRTLRVARSDARLVGVREKHAKAKAEAAEASKK